MRSPARGRALLAIVAVTLLLASCHSAASQPARVPADTDTAGCIPDETDKCPAIAVACAGSEDEDGCPEPLFTMTKDCELGDGTAKELDEAAKDINRAAPIVLRLLSGSPTCVNAVRDALITRGVDRDAIETKASDANGNNGRGRLGSWNAVQRMTLRLASAVAARETLSPRG